METNVRFGSKADIGARNAGPGPEKFKRPRYRKQSPRASGSTQGGLLSPRTEWVMLGSHLMPRSSVVPSTVRRCEGLFAFAENLPSVFQTASSREHGTQFRRFYCHLEGNAMQKVGLLALLLLSTAASAATDIPASSQRLAPGKPAGVKAAQMWDDDNTPLIVMGLAAVGIGIALAVSNDDNGPAPVATNPPTTSTTP